MIYEMKSLKSPDQKIRFVMDSVCLLFGEKEDWDSSKKILGKINFLESLLEFKMESVPEKKWNKLKSVYLEDPNFKKDVMINVSLAATSILTWVIATEKFY